MVENTKIIMQFVLGVFTKQTYSFRSGKYNFLVGTSRNYNDLFWCIFNFIITKKVIWIVHLVIFKFFLEYITYSFSYSLHGSKQIEMSSKVSGTNFNLYLNNIV